MGEIVKVAFIGTSCAGKSTLLDLCAESMGDSALFVDEAAREYFTNNPEVTDRFSAKVQGEVQALAFKKERRAHQQARDLGHIASIICDRSVLDAPTYVYSQGDDEGARELLAIALDWLPTYSRLYLLDPSDIPYETDEVRTEDEATRQLFHEAFLDFFYDYSLPYRLLSGTVEDRHEQVAHFINQQIEQSS